MLGLALGGVEDDLGGVPTEIASGDRGLPARAGYGPVRPSADDRVVCGAGHGLGELALHSSNRSLIVASLNIMPFVIVYLSCESREK